MVRKRSRVQISSLAQPEQNTISTKTTLYKLKIEELDNSVSINTIIYDFKLPKNLFKDSEFLGYLSNAEKRVYMYKELMKKYSQSMNEISSYLENLKNNYN